MSLRVDGATTGVARRRRERRLRMHWRHEQLSLQMALAAALHHSRDGERGTYFSLRAQETARAGGAAGAEYDVMSEDGELLAAVYGRPAARGLLDRRGPQRRQEVDEPSLNVLALQEGADEGCNTRLAAVLSELQQRAVQDLPDGKVSPPVFRVLQPVDVEQVLDVPVLHVDSGGRH